MPILRRAPDNTLAETLGNLGAHLAENWGPKSAAEVAMLRRQMLLRDLEIRKQQQMQEAEDAAIAQYRNIVAPKNLPFIVDAVRRGMSPETILKYSLQLAPEGLFIDANTPEAEAHNRAVWVKLKGEPYALAGPMPVGPATSQAKADFDARASGGKTGADVSATEKAKQDARMRFGANPYEDNPTDPAARQRDLDKYRVINQAEPPANWAPGPRTQEADDRYRTGLDVRKTYEEEEAKRRIAGIPTEGRYFPGGEPPVPSLFGGAVQRGAGVGAGGPTPTPGQAGGAGQGGGPAPAQAPSQAQGGGQAPSAITTPSKLPGSYAQPIPVVTPLGDKGYTIGESAAASGQRTTSDIEDKKVLTLNYEHGKLASEINQRLDEAIALTQYIDNTSLTAQARFKIAQWLGERGYTVDDLGAAIAARHQLLQTRLPAIIKEANARFAGPEIRPFQSQLGTDDMRPDALLEILAREKAYAEISIERSRQAEKVLWGNEPYAKYREDERVRQDTIPERVKGYNTKYGTIYDKIQRGPFDTVTAPAPAAPAPVPAPAPQAPAPEPQAQRSPQPSIVPEVVPAGPVPPAPVPAPVPAPGPAAPAPVPAPAQAPAPQVFRMTPDGRFMPPAPGGP